MADTKSSSTSSETTSATDTPADLAELSRDSEKSTYTAAPVPDDVTPKPGPSTIQELGKP